MAIKGQAGVSSWSFKAFCTFKVHLLLLWIPLKKSFIAIWSSRKFDFTLCRNFLCLLRRQFRLFFQGSLPRKVTMDAFYVRVSHHCVIVVLQAWSWFSQSSILQPACSGSPAYVLAANGSRFSTARSAYHAMLKHFSALARNWASSFTRGDFLVTNGQLLAHGYHE